MKRHRYHGRGSLASLVNKGNAECGRFARLDAGHEDLLLLSCGAVGQPSISGSDGISVERWKAWSGDPIVDPRTTEASDGYLTTSSAEA